MLATLAQRAFQVVFGAVVLGLSIKAIQWQTIGSAPATTSYSAFAGAFTILAALIGIAAVFMSAIPDMIMAGIDGLASILLLAGGIAFAVGLKGLSCTNIETRGTLLNKFVTGGCKRHKDDYKCGYLPFDDGGKDQLEGRCKLVEADAAFLFLGFVASVVGAVLCLIASRRGGVGKRSAV